MLEKDIIEEIRRKVHNAGFIPGIGIGDDAALLMMSSMEHNQLVIASDSIVEGIHFDSKWCNWADVAAKLFEVNASDILVKGAVPSWALLVMNLTPGFARDQKARTLFVDELASRLIKNNVALIGGDITASSVNSFHLTLLASSRHFIPRRAEEISTGDFVVMKGEVGASSFALEKLSGNLPITEKQALAYRRPSAQWNNEWLHLLSAKASIDQSDSLHETLQILTEENKIGIEVDLGKIPAPSLAETEPSKRALQILQAAEDFAQIAILPPVEENILKSHDLVCIGKVISVPGLVYKSFDGSLLDHSGISAFKHF